MAKEKENTIGPEEYKKLTGQDLSIEKYRRLDLEKLAEKGKRYGFTICKEGLHKALHDLNPYEKVIYINLRLYASNETNLCWPPMRQQAEDLNLDRNTIKKYIATLKRKRFLEIEIKKGKGGKSFKYRLLK